MKNSKLIEELKKLNDKLLWQKDKARQTTMDLELSASSNKHEAPPPKISNLKKSSNGSEPEVEDLPKT
jgi:hypothetical protein